MLKSMFLLPHRSTSPGRPNLWQRSIGHFWMVLIAIVLVLAAGPRPSVAQTQVPVNLYNMFQQQPFGPITKSIQFTIDGNRNVLMTVSFRLPDAGFVINWGSVVVNLGTYGGYGTGTPAVFAGITGAQPTPNTPLPVSYSVNISCVRNMPAPQVVTVYSHTYVVAGPLPATTSGNLEDGVPFLFYVNENGNQLLASRFGAYQVGSVLNNLILESNLNNLSPSITVDTSLGKALVTVRYRRLDSAYCSNLGPAYKTGSKSYTVNAVVQRDPSVAGWQYVGYQSCTYDLGYVAEGQYYFTLTQNLSVVRSLGFSIHYSHPTSTTSPKNKKPADKQKGRLKVIR